MSQITRRLSFLGGRPFFTAFISLLTRRKHPNNAKIQYLNIKENINKVWSYWASKPRRCEPIEFVFSRNSNFCIKENDADSLYARKDLWLSVALEPFSLVFIQKNFCSLFVAFSLDTFNVVSPRLRHLVKLTTWHNKSGFVPGWFVRKVPTDRRFFAIHPSTYRKTSSIFVYKR